MKITSLFRRATVDRLSTGQRPGIGKRRGTRRLLQVESLEPRQLLAADVFVNDNWFEASNGGGTAGVVDAGDLVDNRLDVGAAPRSGTFDLDAFANIQDGINAVEVGGTVHVLAGSYTENVTINSKDLNLLGEDSGAGAPPTWQPEATGNLITITGSAFGDDETVSVANFSFDGSSGLADRGIHVPSATNFSRLVVSDSSFTGFDFNAISVFGSAAAGSLLENVQISTSTFSGNGFNAAGGTGDIQLFQYNGNASFTMLTLTGTATTAPFAHSGIQLRGIGDGSIGSPTLPSGTVTFDDVDISGDYRTQFIGIQRYSDVSGFSFNDVELGGAGSDITGGFGAALRLDAIGNIATKGLPGEAALDLGNMYFRGIDGPHGDIEIAPDNSFAWVRVDATNTRWDTTVDIGTDVSASALTREQAFEVEDRILHFVDGLHPMHGTFKGFVEVQDGQAFVTTTNGGSINRGIEVVDAAGTVNVGAGVFDQDVLVNRPDLHLLGSGPNVTSLRGVQGGDGATVRISANGVEIEGFTITRLGNNTTDWNDPALNSTGIAIQGQAITGSIIHDNLITENRTAIDINNSNGHTIRNNVITDNHTGLIFRNQTDNLTVVENEITENRTVGILFLDASGGVNVPVQTALNSTFTNNNISGNWYGEIVDRQSGGALPIPGSTNLKDFSGNWFGTIDPTITTANSAEPGYASHIPVEFGGTATDPGGQPDIAGPASANFDITPLLSSGTDTNIETTAGRGTFGFQGSFASLHVTAEGAQTGALGRIQEGIERVDVGGVVNVKAGAYSETATVTKNVNLLGAQTGVDPELRDLVVDLALETTVTADGAADVAFHVDPNLTDVTIDGFNIDGGGTGLQGVNGSGHSGLSVLNNFVHDFTSIGVALETGTTGGLVRFNQIFDTFDGVYLATGASNHTIADNFIFDSTSTEGDITLEGNNTNVIIRNNTLDSDTAAGVFVFANFGSDFTGTALFENAFLGPVGVNNTNTATINAEGNWWDTTVPAQVDAKAIGNVDFNPFLTDGTDTQPNVSGFQPLATQNAIVTVDANGNLIIEGTSDDDTVTITGVGTGTGEYIVTTQQGNGPVVTTNVVGVTGGFDINLRAGEDHLTMNNVYVAGAILVEMEEGNDTVILGNLDVVSSGQRLQIGLGNGNDTIDGKRLFIGGDQLIYGGAGDDQLLFNGFASPQFTLGTSAAGLAFWSGDVGNDTVSVTYGFIVQSWGIYLGDGDDTLEVFGSAASGDVIFSGDADNDDLTVDTNFFDATHVIFGLAGNDSVLLRAGLGTEFTTISTGDGNDRVTVDNQTTNRLDVVTGAGEDQVDIQASAFDQFFVQLGEDNDQLTVRANLVQLETGLNGGPGSADRLLDQGNDFRGVFLTGEFEL